MTELSNTRVICLHAQDDLRIETRPVGTPGPGEVLVTVEVGGICGSDLHYWLEGGIGTIRVQEPIILGHEASGRIAALGEGVTGLMPGQLVAMNPSQPCGTCSFCQQGLPRHCSAMRFKGSAMYLPHEQGMFRDRIVIAADQCLPVPDGTDPGAAACSEPLAVCLHAANRGEAIAGSLASKIVMVTGAGPIGALCVAVARQRGASEIIVTDIQDATLAIATRMGQTIRSILRLTQQGSCGGRKARARSIWYLSARLRHRPLATQFPAYDRSVRLCRLESPDRLFCLSTSWWAKKSSSSVHSGSIQSLPRPCVLLDRRLSTPSRSSRLPFP